MDLTMIVITLYIFVSFVSFRGATLQNPNFESPPTNLTTNATSQFVLLDTRTNVIPGWSFNGTVWYVTAGGNVSLPGNGHGMRLGPNGMINQTFKSDKDDTYDYVLTFTLAPSSMDCANNFTAVNVSGPSGSQVFSYKESVGTEMWQTYAFSMWSSEIRKGVMGIQIQSVVTGRRGNMTCWPLVDTFIIAITESPRMYSDRGLVNSGFEVGPTFLENSSQGILLEGDWNNVPWGRSRVCQDYTSPIPCSGGIGFFVVVVVGDWNNDAYAGMQSPLQQWDILGLVKYIDSKHFAVPRGRGAIELIYASPSGIAKDIYFLRHGQATLDFIMGDANDSCVGDLTVFLQVKDMIWNFTTRSIGVGSSERHSVTFKAEFSSNESVPISFYTLNETRTSDNRVLCGPVIDSPRLQLLTSLSSEKVQIKFMIPSFILTLLLLLVL